MLRNDGTVKVANDVTIVTCKDFRSSLLVAGESVKTKHNEVVLSSLESSAARRCYKYD